MIATGVKEPQCQITNALSSSECCESLSVSVISAVQEHREKNRRKGRSRVSWKTWETAPEHEPSWGTVAISVLSVGILLRKWF